MALGKKQAEFYNALKAKSPEMAKRFLGDLQKKQARQKDVENDAVLQLRKEAVDLGILSKLDNRGVHNFSIGCLDAYHYLDRYIDTGRAFLFRGRVLVMPAMPSGWKSFVFDYVQEDLPELRMLQHHGLVYSLDPVPGLPKQSKFEEVAYDLNVVFDPASYPNTKKRKNKIRHPLTYLKGDSIRIEPVSEENIGECRRLHDQWVDRKLADERTYRMMFPVRRYMRCAEKASAGLFEKFPSVRYEGFAFSVDGELAGVNVNAVENGGAYGLAMFGKIWDPAFNRLMGATDLWCMRRALDNGVEYYNAGTTVNEGHRAYKERYPCRIVESYLYSRIKEGI